MITEKVLCIPTRVLPKFEGLLYNPTDYLGPAITSRFGHYLERSLVENNPDWKQIIPYIIVKTENSRYLRYRRKGTEQRLHGLYSIGVGGHVNEHSIEDSIDRELKEEIGTTTEIRYWKALVNERQTAVGLVHLGILILAKVFKENIQVNEETEGAEFLTLEELCETPINQYEIWSQYALLFLKND